MDLLVDRVAGLDVHRDSVMTCIRAPSPSGRGRSSETRQFPTTTAGLRSLSRFLVERQVTQVAMEATGVYWKPVYYALEHDFEVMLVNAAHMKNVPGRKTDVADAAWIAQLLEHGLLRASFVPPPDIRRLRDLTRYRKTVINEHTRVVQRLEKVLQDAGIKLSSVASTVLSVSGRAMLEALVAGVDDPTQLAQLARGRMRSKLPALAEALEGNFGAHHAVIVRECLGHADVLDGAIERVSAEIGCLLAPHRWAVDLLVTIPGVSVRTAEVILAEIGLDMTRFPTAGHLASWAGMCPGNHESAGKRGPGNVRPGSPWLRHALVEAAQAAGRSRGSYLSPRHARIRARRGKQRATIATGHVILVACWHMLTNRVAFTELGSDYYDHRRSPEAETRRLVRKLQDLGLRVTVEPAA
jgi:transposase